MFCPKCGQLITENETVCPICGAALAPNAAEETPVTGETVKEATEETVGETAEDALTAFADSLRVEDDPILGEEDGEDGEAPADETEAAKKQVSLLSVAAITLALALIVGACGWYFLKNKPTEPVYPDTSVTETHELVYPNGFDYMNTDLTPYVQLGQYTGMTLDVPTDTTVTDAEVKEQIDYMLSQMFDYAEVTGRAAQKDDKVSIDYAGSIDGVAFEGGTGSTDTLVLGSGAMIPGFEDGIVGMQIGETGVVDATFPENYGKADLAGKTAQFEITLKAISEKQDAVYNDEFVKENFGMDTTAELEARMREELTAQKEEEAKNALTEAALKAAADNATFPGYPDGLIEDFMVQEIEYLQSMLPYYYGTDYATFVSESGYESVGAFEEEMVRPRAMDNAKQELVIFAIAKAENITASDEDYEAELAQFLAYYGEEDVPSFCEKAGVEESFVESTVRSSVVYSKVLALLTEQNAPAK